MSCHKCGNSGHRAWRCNTQQCINTVKLKLNDPELIAEASQVTTGNSILDSSDMDIHIDASQNTKRFECNECSFQCTYLEILNEHKQTHTGEKLTKCCEMHTGESPNQCDKCGGNNDNETALEDHILPHNGEKPDDRIDGEYKCKQCQYICMNEDVLINHLKTHNIYICNKCEFEGKTQQALSSHLKIHKQKSFKCSSCDFTCTNLSKLNAHKKDHAMEEIIVETPIEIANNAKNTPPSTKVNKRNLSVSPESTETDRKTSKKNKKNYS